MLPRNARWRQLLAFSAALAAGACTETPTAVPATDLSPSFDHTTGHQVFKSGTHVDTWNAIVGPQVENGEATYCKATPLYGPGAAWTNPHKAFLGNGAAFRSWTSHIFVEDWINAWPSQSNGVPEWYGLTATYGGPAGSKGQSWSRYQTPVSGQGDFVLYLAADNCSWIYITDAAGNNPQLVGVQLGAPWVVPITYPVTLNGNHRLEFIVYDGGGQSGGMFRLETNTGQATFTDTDSDGLADVSETNVHGTNPNNADTDGDGINDGDEVANGTNPTVFNDADGDGVADHVDVEPTLSNFYYYVDWTSANPGAGTASGTISLPGGQTVGVNLRVLNPNGTSGSFYFGQTSGGTTFWQPSGPYVSGFVLNAPPATEIIALTGGTTSSYVITFSQSVQDPVMDILSLGSGGDPSVYDFDRSFEIISQGTGYWGSGLFASQPGEQLIGREGHGAIRFIGSFGTFSWSVPDGEVWHGFTIAIRGLGDANADYDGDGEPDATDNCPLVSNADQSDSDFDGVGNACDLVDDGNSDSDGDGLTNSQEHGIGTNPTNPDTDGDSHNDGSDAFPLDPTRWISDGDGDGVANDVDNCPLVANANQANNDGDGQGDACDPDDDNDGVLDGDDKFPLDPTESVDTDGDGTGNNADTDDDNDGVLDGDDAFPLDPTESVDTDGDGTGNNADTDDDGDGVLDGDDAFPLDPTESVDTDGDGTGNNADTDDDNDGVLDGDDAFPLDPTESVDTDGDGTGNNADTDDDGDGVNDTLDAHPLDATRWRWTIGIDIKPGSSENPVNVKEKGDTPVAIYSTADFDATTILWNTVRFGPGQASESHGRSHIEDVNQDGRLDMVLHFDTQKTNVVCGATSLTLTGMLSNGRGIEGSDIIVTKGCK